VTFNATWVPDAGGTVSFDLAPGRVGGGLSLRYSERLIPASAPPEHYIDLSGPLSVRLVLAAFFAAADVANFATLQSYVGLPGTLTSVIAGGSGYLLGVRLTQGAPLAQVWADVEVLLT
jgi:hypothetical protein